MIIDTDTRPPRIGLLIVALLAFGTLVSITLSLDLWLALSAR